jgi:hypothetical protein
MRSRIDGTAKPAGQVEAHVAPAWDSVVEQINAALPNRVKR